jgi:DNA-binding IclR family transcriptional regulator
MHQPKPDRKLPLRFRNPGAYQNKLRPSKLVLDRQQFPAQPNQSLIDSMRVLQALVFHNRPMSGVEIARELEIEPVRAHRLLKTLSVLGMAFQTPRRRFTAGPGMHVLAAQSLLNSDLATAARAPLDELHLATGLQVAMGMLWQDYVSYIYHASPDLPLEAAPGQVSIFPASQSSLGQILMSDLDERQVREIYHQREIPGYEETGIMGLLEDLRLVRRRGYARVERKTETGRITIAIRVVSRPFAAIGVGGDIPSGLTASIVAQLTSTAEAIGSAMEEPPATRRPRSIEQ